MISLMLVACNGEKESITKEMPDIFQEIVLKIDGLYYS